jgi:acyl-[acyl-carrier-protein] desaturase
LERGRMDHVSRGYYPAGEFDALDGLVYVTLQELATRISHRNTGAITEDPVAEKLMARIAIDENLHYIFYRDVTAAALEIDPSGTMRAIHWQVAGFSMPGLELPGFREKAISIAKEGIYDLRIHHDQILVPVLFKQWRIDQIQGLDAGAERARDETMKVLDAIDRAASRFEEKRAS